MLAISLLTEENTEGKTSPCISLNEALQILQLENTNKLTRDVLKEQYLKLATAVHPHRVQNDKDKEEFIRLSHAAYAAFFTFQCPNCRLVNCKECWHTQDLLSGSECLAESPDQLHTDHKICCEEFYIYALERYFVNFKTGKKSKEKMPSVILSPSDKEMMFAFLDTLIKEEKSDCIEDCEGCSKCDNNKSTLEEVEVTSPNIQIENSSSICHASRRRNRRARMRHTQDSSKSTSVSKSEVIDLENKRKHEIEDIRKELLKKAKLADQPKQHKAPIAVRRGIYDKDMKEEIERQKREKENRQRELQKKMKQQATQERSRNRKLKRNMKKKNLNSSSSSAYPTSLSDTSSNTSSDFRAIDSSFDICKDEEMKVIQSKDLQVVSKQLDSVVENPLLEERKRCVTTSQDAQVEESKKLKLSQEGEPSGIDSGFDKTAILAQLREKERQRNMTEDECKKRNRRVKRSRKKKVKARNSPVKEQQVSAEKIELDSSQLSIFSSSSMSLEAYSNGSHLQDVEVPMDTGLSLDTDTGSKACPSRSLTSSSHETSLNNYSNTIERQRNSEALQCQTKRTYANIAAVTRNQSNHCPPKRPSDNDISFQSAEANKSIPMSIRQTNNVNGNDQSIFKIAPSPDLRQSLFSKTQVSAGFHFKSPDPIVSKPLVSYNFSHKISQPFPLSSPLKISPKFRALTVSDESICLGSDRTSHDSFNIHTVTENRMDTLDEITADGEKSNLAKVVDRKVFVYESHPSYQTNDPSPSHSVVEEKLEGNIDELENKLSQNLSLGKSTINAHPDDEDRISSNDKWMNLHDRIVPDNWDNEFCDNDKNNIMGSNSLQGTQRMKETVLVAETTNEKICKHRNNQAHSKDDYPFYYESIWDIEEPNDSDPSHMLKKINRNTAVITRAKDSNKVQQDSLSDQMALMQPHISKRCETENLLNDETDGTLKNATLSRDKSKEMLKKPFIFSLPEKMPNGGEKTVGDKPFLREASRKFKGNAMAVLKTSSVNTTDHEENWTEDSADGLQFSSLSHSHNFLLATQSLENSANKSFPKMTPIQFLDKDKRASLMTEVKDILSGPTLMANNLTYSSNNRKILHPIRRPKTVTQCMQTSQAKMAGLTDHPTGKSVPKKSFLETFSWDKDPARAVIDPKPDERQIKAHTTGGDITSRDQIKAKSNKRSTNPSALLLTALNQIKEENGLSSNASIPTVRKPSSPTIGKPSIPTVWKPSSPTIGKPSRPTVWKPSSPTIGKPSIPIVWKPSSPTIGKPSIPTVRKPSSPTIGKPSIPTVRKPSSPTIGKPSSPTVKKPSIPSVSEPFIPTIGKPSEVFSWSKLNSIEFPSNPSIKTAKMLPKLILSRSFSPNNN